MASQQDLTLLKSNRIVFEHYNASNSLTSNSQQAHCNSQISFLSARDHFNGVICYCRGNRKGQGANYYNPQEKIKIRVCYILCKGGLCKKKKKTEI